MSASTSMLDDRLQSLSRSVDERFNKLDERHDQWVAVVSASDHRIHATIARLEALVGQLQDRIADLEAR